MNIFLKLVIIISWLCSILACVTAPQIVGVYQDENKNWKAKADPEIWSKNAQTEQALRDENGLLITNRMDAEKNIKNYKNAHDLQHLFFSCGSENTFESSKKYYSGLNKLKLNQFSEAQAEWNQATELCKDLGDYSLLHFFKAKAFLGEQNEALAREELKLFVTRSAAISPQYFYQENAESLLQYKKQAESFLNNETQNLVLEEQENNQVAKMAPNTFFSPGGSQQEFSFLFPIFRTQFIGLRNEYLFGFSYLKSWGEWSINPAIFNSSTLGSLMSFSIKKSLYESPSRDLNVSTWLRINEWKQAMLKYNFGSMTSQVENLTKGYNTYFGIGLTKRLSPIFSTNLASYLVDDTFENKIKLNGDLYLNYGFNDLFSIYGGTFAGDSVAGISLVQIIMFGYNFSQKLIDVRIYGLYF